MPVMDEFRESRDKIKHGTRKEKLNYFWDYYKWHTIGAIVLIVFVVTTIHGIVTNTETAVQGIFLNSFNHNEEKTQAFYNGFIEREEIDTEEYSLDLNFSLGYDVREGADTSLNYNTLQVLQTWNMAEQLDFITGDLDCMNDLAYRGFFMDLRDILSSEQIEKYEDRFIYMDRAFYIARQEASSNMEDVSAWEIPDSSKPEEMEDPVPVMIDMTGCKKLEELYEVEFERLTFSFVLAGQRREMAKEFLDYLFE